MYPSPHLALIIVIAVSTIMIIGTVILSAYISTTKTKGYFMATKQQVIELVTQVHNLTTETGNVGTRVQKKLDDLATQAGDDPDITAAINEIKNDVSGLQQIAADTQSTNTALAGSEGVQLPAGGGQ
jgi:hypothetical protein